VAHLHQLGHRRIATITGPETSLPATERLAGYRNQTARLGLPYRPEYVVTGDFFLASGRSAMRRLLALPEPPTAVFAAGDEMAVGAMDALAEAGISVPGQMSVVGYDDVEAAALVRPALTTVAQDSRHLATAAAYLLANLITVARPDSATPGDNPDHGDDPDRGDTDTTKPGDDAVPGNDAGDGTRADAVRSGCGPRLVPNRLVVRASTGPPQHRALLHPR
jgi:LacI family transcriptional regulator